MNKLQRLVKEEFKRQLNEDIDSALINVLYNNLNDIHVRLKDEFGGNHQFSKVFATASRLQTIKPNLTMLLRAEYQWTKDLLIPLEQYSVGGPDNVRAFPQAQQLFDQALFLSVELIQNMPFITNVSAFGNRTWGELVQLSVFYDQVVGRLNNPLSTEPKGHINFKGAGVQMRFTLPGTLESRFMWAWQMGGPRPSDNARVPQFWGDSTYRF